MIIECLTGALVVITFFYAWVTYKILRANEKVVQVMREQADAITRPYVSAAPFLEPDNPIFYLRIKNSGKTAAQNLRLSFDKSFFQFGEKSGERDIANYTAFNEVIDALPPDAEIVFALAQSFKIFGDGDPAFLPKSFCITAEYFYGEKNVKESNIIDLRPYYCADVPQDPYVRKLKDIKEAIDGVAKKMPKP